MGKGDQTRRAICVAGMRIASTEGLDAITIGQLAEQVGMSKSGLFAHFQSKEALQIALLEHGREEFIGGVIAPALKAPRGRPRLESLFERWMSWNHSNETDEPPSDVYRGGCLFLRAAGQFDDRPGEVRDALVRILEELLEFLEGTARQCIDEGHLSADSDPRELRFEIYSLVVGQPHPLPAVRGPRRQEPDG